MSILEILEAHQRHIRNGRCSCEEDGPKRTGEEHRAHVAQMLEQHEREAKAEALEEAADDIVVQFGNETVMGFPDPDEVEFPSWLRARANQMRVGSE